MACAPTPLVPPSRARCTRHWRTRTLAATVLLAGCASAPAATATPASAVRDYAGALRGGQLGPARAAVVASARPGPDTLGAQLSTHRAELAELASALDEAAGAVVGEARVELPGGETLVLVRDPEGFRFAADPLGAGGLRTPRDALAAFRRALARGQRLGLSHVLVRARRAAVAAEAADWLEQTADADRLDVQVDGERAQVRTPAGRTLVLVREFGEWRVAELL